MLDSLHSFLGAVLFGAYSDLAWSAVRAITAVCSFNAGWAVRRSPDRFLIWATLLLGAWVSLKVVDDLTHHGKGPALTPYFMVSNILWSFVLIGLARMAYRERAALETARALIKRQLDLRTEAA